MVGHALPDGQSDFPQLPLPQHPAATNMTAPANAAIIRAFLNIFISPFLLVTGTPDRITVTIHDSVKMSNPHLKKLLAPLH